MDNELYLKCLMLCSGHYLCANYPDNWENLSENEQLEFIGDNLWEPMENESPELVQSAIESAAIATYHFIEDLNQSALSALAEPRTESAGKAELIYTLIFDISYQYIDSCTSSRCISVPLFPKNRFPIIRLKLRSKFFSNLSTTNSLQNIA